MVQFLIGYREAAKNLFKVLVLGAGCLSFSKAEVSTFVTLL